VFKSDF